MVLPILAPGLLGGIAAGAAVGLFLSFRLRRRLQSGVDGRIGLRGSGKEKCPQCGVPFPVLRRPKNVREARWGGWTCPQCGGEFDRRLRPVPRRA
jgi:hypothetical protein